MSSLGLGSTPVHTLHTPHPVRRVRWRPGCDTEVAIVPQTPGISQSAGAPGLPGTTTEASAPSLNTSTASGVSDADRVEIWDVRRGWIGKYVLLGGEGSVSGKRPFFSSLNRPFFSSLLSFIFLLP